MEYNKFSDGRRVNATAMFCYGMLTIVLIISIFLQVLNKSRTWPYFLIFLVLALIPYVACKILLHQSKDSEKV